MHIIKNFIKKHHQEITLIVLFLGINFMFFYSHGNISTDIGREAMIPMALLNGEIMYKDILNIYAPLAYYINACIMAALGIKLESLYIGGIISSFISLFMLLKIAKKFLEKRIAELLIIFIAITCFYNSTLFNFIMPYAFSVTYALCFIFSAIYLLILYTENKNDKYLLFAGLLSGAAFACKVEYFGICIITLFVSIFTTKDIARILKHIVTICVTPFIAYLIPIIQGMNTKEAMEAFCIFLKEANSPSMINFSKTVGTIYTNEDILSWGIGLICFSIFVATSVLLLKASKNKISYLIALFVATIIHYISKGEMHFSYLPILLTTYTILNFRKLLTKPAKFILVSSSILTSLKTFFNTDILLYGAFTLPLLLISLIVIIFDDYSKIIEEGKVHFTLTQKSSLKTLIVFLLISGTMSNFFYNANKKIIYSSPIKTEMGRIDTSLTWAKQSKRLLTFIEENTKEEDKILFLPEGCLFNFLSQRKTDMKMYVLDSIFIETLGEQKIINNLLQYKYIVILDGFGLGSFGESNFYKTQNKVTNFIKEHYGLIYHEKAEDTEIIFLERLQ